jgi:hypothetical protein
VSIVKEDEFIPMGGGGNMGRGGNMGNMGGGGNMGNMGGGGNMGNMGNMGGVGNIGRGGYMGNMGGGGNMGVGGNIPREFEQERTGFGPQGYVIIVALSDEPTPISL